MSEIHAQALYVTCKFSEEAFCDLVVILPCTVREILSYLTEHIKLSAMGIDELTSLYAVHQQKVWYQDDILESASCLKYEVVEVICYGGNYPTDRLS